MKITPRSQVIVDCQLLQTSDRFRGMGMFLYSLLSHYKADEDTKFLFVTNSKLKDLSASDRELLSQFGGELISGSFAIRDDGLEFVEAAPKNKKHLDEILRPYISERDGAKSIYFIPAVFSSEIYPVFPSKGTANIMLFHDLIPFLYSEHYFADHEGAARRDYAQRFREVYRTDLFVTNSQTTADDLTVYFGIDPQRILPIMGGGASRSHLAPKMPEAMKGVDDFILMPSGDDFRKNNTRAVTALAGLDANIKLVIPSRFSEETKKQLSEIYPHAMFVGSVSDEEFLWLIDNSRFVFFPTEYEGLGMPLLEAIERDAMIACSNIPVFAEISTEAFTYFDPKSPSSMGGAIAELLEEKPKALTAAHKKMYRAIEKRFSWELSAKLFKQAISKAEVNPPRQKLAVLCPSPSSYSAVGKYAFQIHGELARYFEVDYFIENGVTPHPPTRPNILEFAANKYLPAHLFHGLRTQYDKVLYHIGNSEFHVETILEGLRSPAVAVVHDTMLNGIFDFMANRGFMSAERRDFERLLDTVGNITRSSCLTSLATNQQALLCHSDYAMETLGEVTAGYNTRLKKVALPVGVPSVALEKGEQIVVSFAGIISEDKGIRLVAETSSIDDVAVKVFGFGVLGNSPLLQGLGNKVEIMKNLTDKEFQDALRGSDVLVNYRVNYHGETSLSTLEAMRYGVVVIVNDVGWYAELPNDTVVKVKNEDQVIKAVQDLAENPEKRKKISENARKYIQENYTYAAYAHDISRVLEGES